MLVAEFVIALTIIGADRHFRDVATVVATPRLRLYWSQPVADRGNDPCAATNLRCVQSSC